MCFCCIASAIRNQHSVLKNARMEREKNQMSLGPQVLATGEVIVPYDSFTGEFCSRISSHVVEDRLGEGRGRFGPNMQNLSRMARPHAENKVRLEDEIVKFTTSCGFMCCPCCNMTKLQTFPTQIQQVDEQFYQQIETELYSINKFEKEQTQGASPLVYQLAKWDPKKSWPHPPPIPVRRSVDMGKMRNRRWSLGLGHLLSSVFMDRGIHILPHDISLRLLPSQQAASAGGVLIVFSCFVDLAEEDPRRAEGAARVVIEARSALAELSAVTGEEVVLAVLGRDREETDWDGRLAFVGASLGRVRDQPRAKVQLRVELSAGQRDAILTDEKFIEMCRTRVSKILHVAHHKHALRQLSGRSASSSSNAPPPASLWRPVSVTSSDSGVEGQSVTLSVRIAFTREGGVVSADAEMCSVKSLMFTLVDLPRWREIPFNLVDLGGEVKVPVEPSRSIPCCEELDDGVVDDFWGCWGYRGTLEGESDEQKKHEIKQYPESVEVLLCNQRGGPRETLQRALNEVLERRKKVPLKKASQDANRRKKRKMQKQMQNEVNELNFKIKEEEDETGTDDRTEQIAPEPARDSLREKKEHLQADDLIAGLKFELQESHRDPHPVCKKEEQTAGSCPSLCPDRPGPDFAPLPPLLPPMHPDEEPRGSTQPPPNASTFGVKHEEGEGELSVGLLKSSPQIGRSRNEGAATKENGGSTYWSESWREVKRAWNRARQYGSYKLPATCPLRELKIVPQVGKWHGRFFSLVYARAVSNAEIGVFAAAVERNIKHFPGEDELRSIVDQFDTSEIAQATQAPASHFPTFLTATDLDKFLMSVD
uniref:Uncharacterized protein n=1 Tax=Chromera velia CCMP2878 TaxID=1169474 RepID=A0A0G4HGT3_9ALVE|eukprot:Cvel_27353.t1-p1 / transcript=Cvel_27353.t1 / gene=Cvel_27353 / organism=Chromera_velia_CCMP2878 / gene_product=hypothetical protein / transcript_product=hypothetical protein / location=Cvel_scaffold3398:1766-9951(-) / protein_length=820 / sequence_SO=supercontig / SO=protein_coding / is_pseudo=false